MGDQVFRDFRGYTEYQIDGSVNHASIVESADQFRTGARCLLRPFENDRTTGGECDADLAHRLINRKIPRRKRGYGTDGLLDHQLINAFRTRRNNTAIGAACLLRQTNR